MALTLITAHANSVRTIYLCNTTKRLTRSLLPSVEPVLANTHARSDAHPVNTSSVTYRLADVIVLARLPIPFQTNAVIITNAEPVHANPIAWLRITNHSAIPNRQAETLIALADIWLSTTPVGTIHQLLIAARLTHASAVFRESITRNALADVRLDTVGVDTSVHAVRCTARLLGADRCNTDSLT